MLSRPLVSALTSRPVWFPLLAPSPPLSHHPSLLLSFFFVCLYVFFPRLSSLFFKFLFEVSVVRSLSSFFFSLRPSHYLSLMVTVISVERLIAYTGIGIISNNELISLRIEKNRRNSRKLCPPLFLGCISWPLFGSLLALFQHLFPYLFGLFRGFALVRSASSLSSYIAASFCPNCLYLLTIRPIMLCVLHCSSFQHMPRYVPGCQKEIKMCKGASVICMDESCNTTAGRFVNWHLANPFRKPN